MTVQDEIRQRIEKDALLARLRKKIDNGKGTYADSFAYSDRAGKLLGELFSRRLPDIPLEEREARCVELLRDRYTDINQLIDRVQRVLDEAQNLHIAPQHAPFNSERASVIGHALVRDDFDEDRHIRVARSATATATRAMHDDRMKKEADFRSRAGLQCYITRKTDGKCCEWCSAMAGRYEYHSEPKDIYRRHDNCGCSVTYENGRQRQDVWSKREWEAPEPGAGAGELHRLSGDEAATAGAPDPVVLTKEQAARVVAVQAGTMDYMSNSFRPKLSSSTEMFHFNAAKIPVYRVQNSDFQLYTDNPNPKAKATRTAEKLLRAALPFLPDGFEIPPVLVVDFNAHGLNLDSSGNKHDVIGGFVAELGVMFLNSQYNTYEKILQYVRRNEGFFANHTVLAPVLHELGHKYYEDCVKGLANSGGMSYNEAKQMINRAIFEQLLMMEKSSVILSDAISIYADIGYKRQKFSEVIAESFSVMQENQAAKGIIKSLEVLRNDGFK